MTYLAPEALAEPKMADKSQAQQAQELVALALELVAPRE
jgi:hypothetical protein